jgi:hypothetical protein
MADVTYHVFRRKRHGPIVRFHHCGLLPRHAEWWRNGVPELSLDHFVGLRDTLQTYNITLSSGYPRVRAAFFRCRDQLIGEGLVDG